MTTIQSWNDELQTTEAVEIDENSLIMLGCDGEPRTTVSEWMSLQEITTLEEMATYIDGLDFNVQVIA